MYFNMKIIRMIYLKKAEIKEKSYFFLILKTINAKLTNRFINESLIKNIILRTASFLIKHVKLFSASYIININI